MPDALRRAGHYHDLAVECRRLATSTPSSQMKNRYLLMAQDYTRLAGLKEQAHAYRTPATVQEITAWAATSSLSAPWRVVEIPQGFAVEDAAGQQIAVFYGLAEPNTARQTDFLTIDEALQMAVDFAKLPAVADSRLAEMRTAIKFTSFEPDERMPTSLLPRPSDPLSNRAKFLIAIAVAALPAGYFIFRNFDRPVDVAVVPQATSDIPPVEFSSAREADAPSTKTTGIAVERRAEPEVQTAPSPAPLETKPTEGNIHATPPQMLPERGKQPLATSREGRQAFAVSRDDSTCLPSASAVRQNYPGAWPSWTLRAPGHENTTCWYAATRPTTHDHR
jgi:hypothetical protein